MKYNGWVTGKNGDRITVKWMNNTGEKKEQEFTPNKEVGVGDLTPVYIRNGVASLSPNEDKIGFGLVVTGLVFFGIAVVLTFIRNRYKKKHQKTA